MPALVIGYSPVTVSPFTLMVRAPSLSVVALIVTVSPISAVISPIVISASFLFASNILVTV